MSAAARMMCSRSRRLIASRGPHASAPRCTSAPAARRRPQKASPASAHAPLPCRRREARKGVQEGPREGAARRARSAGTARMLASTAPCLAHDGGRVDRSAIARRRRDAERDSAPRRDGGDPPHDYSLPADPGVRAIPRSCTRSSARRGCDAHARSSRRARDAFSRKSTSSWAWERRLRGHSGRWLPLSQHLKRDSQKLDSIASTRRERDHGAVTVDRHGLRCTEDVGLTR